MFRLEAGDAAVLFPGVVADAPVGAAFSPFDAFFHSAAAVPSLFFLPFFFFS